MSDSALIVEIRAAEGGDDAKLLVQEQVAIYAKACAKAGLAADVLDSRPGLTVLRVEGAGVAELFRYEPGGHRWQRIPPNEKRGRVHTSTVTVAVLREPSEIESPIRPGDVTVQATRGSGAGGQNRNKVSSCAIVTHKPTGTAVRCESERSLVQNTRQAMGLLRARLHAAEEARRTGAEAESRRAQVGSGMRGDKVRTIRAQDGIVTHHPTGRRTRLAEYLRGDLSWVADREFT